MPEALNSGNLASDLPWTVVGFTPRRNVKDFPSPFKMHSLVFASQVGEKALLRITSFATDLAQGLGDTSEHPYGHSL